MVLASIFTKFWTCRNLQIIRNFSACSKRSSFRLRSSSHLFLSANAGNCLVRSSGHIPMASGVRDPNFISAKDVQRLLKYEDLVPVIENCIVNFSDRENGGVVQPVRTTIEVTGNNGYLFTMPCFSKKDEALVTKLVTRFPDQQPAHHGIILLFNSTTGAVQTIMDGEVITSMRTAAASAVALKHLTTSDYKTLCILGAGKQAYSHFYAFKHVRNFTKVSVWSRTPANAQKFAKDTGAVPFDTIQAAVKDADVIVTATSSKTPVLFGDWIKPGAFVCAVGAPLPTARELDDVVMHQSTIIVDSYNGAMAESGDIILSKAKIAAELGEVVSGKKTVQLGTNILFKSLGMAVYDAVSAKLVYEKYSSA